MKTCSKCNQEKEYSAFNKDKNKKDGYMSACRDCGRGYYNSYSADYRKTNSEQIKASQAKWYQDNKESVRQRVSEWSKANRDKANAKNRKYKALKLNQIGLLPLNYEQIMREVYGYKCMRCGATESIEVDHVIPASKGGLWCILNFQFLCRGCNASKSNTDTTDYRNKDDLQRLLSYTEEG